MARSPRRRLNRPKPIPAQPQAASALTAGALAKARAESALSAPVDRSRYVCVSSLRELQSWIDEAFEAGTVCFDTETDSLDPMQANLVGVSLALAPGRACYIPLGHKTPGAEDLFGGGDAAPGQLPLREALDLLRPLLTAPSVTKIAQNVKFDWLVLAQHGIEVAPAQDTMLASYTLDAGMNGHGMDELSLKFLGHRPIQFGEVAGQGKSFIGFARVALDKATEYSAEDSDVTLAAVERASAAPRRREHDERLRDAGAADAAGAGADGAARHLRRPGDPRAARWRIRAGHGAARGRGS